MPTAGLISLGCAKNTVDSERMLAELAQAGFAIGADPAEADVVIVNTCGFIEPARQEAIETIREVVGYKRTGPVQRIIVAGCLAQRLGERFFEQVEGIDAVVGLAHRDRIGRIALDVLNGCCKRTYLGSCPEDCADDTGRVLTTSGHWTYLRISEGCSHKCSYCTIPFIRGPFRSKRPEQVLREARELAGSGIVEVNLIAQDTTQYGSDIGLKDGLASIVRGFEQVEGLAWVRLMYLWPVGISSALVDAIGGSAKCVHYLDIPIQHADDTILKAMRRPDNASRLRALIGRLRTAMPDIILRTTVIVGFPGETDAQFERLLGFVRWARFDALGCFAYCREQGTAAAALPGQIPEHVKAERVERLMLAQQEIAFGRNAARMGQRLMCLVDQVQQDGTRIGRHYGQAPEIDSICIIEGCLARPGEFAAVEVTGSRGYDLLARAT